MDFELLGDDELVTTKVAAKALGKSPHTLEAWRCNGQYVLALPYYRIGGNCFYKVRDIKRFIESCRKGG